MDTLAQNTGWRLWHVHAPMVLIVQATPATCLLTLRRAARPNLQRLHLRNLFTEGRRYYLHPLRGGFRLTSNSALSWNRHGRTALAAVVDGRLSDAGEGATIVHLRARWRLFYLLDVFLIPFFIMSILVFTPWPPWLVTLLAVILLGLSWLWHRLTAMLQAADMVYFIQRALEDLPAAERPLLAQPAPDVVMPDSEFREAWESFYRQQTDDAPSSS
ncbi:MAG: hypothetical protein H6671_17940 [Anaerolineaceae bacterium]|nr:hypothetical protein [Anaerolineaceae bacterium]